MNYYEEKIGKKRRLDDLIFRKEISIIKADTGQIKQYSQQADHLRNLTGQPIIIPNIKDTTDIKFQIGLTPTIESSFKGSGSLALKTVRILIGILDLNFNRPKKFVSIKSTSDELDNGADEHNWKDPLIEVNIIGEAKVKTVGVKRGESKFWFACLKARKIQKR